MRGRRYVLVTAAVLALAAPATAPAQGEPALDDAGYLGVADRTVTRVEGMWDEKAGRYAVGDGVSETLGNAALLVTHSAAARYGHTGAARQDERARRIVAALTGMPPLRDDVRDGPRFGGALDSPGPVLPIVDSGVAEGLAAAYIARDALGLDRDLVRRMREHVLAVAGSRFYRRPRLQMGGSNQMNWYAMVHAAAWVVSGEADGLVRDLDWRLRRFARDVGRPGRAAGNLGPGLRFHYYPHQRASHPLNVDSSEYANVVLAVARLYGAARTAGMPRPAAATSRLLREWVRRVIAGTWTHGGYLNWDTGYGFRRWHQAKKHVLAQEALIGIAGTPELQPTAAWGAWAKWLLDRGIRLQERWAEAEGGLVSAIRFGVVVRAPAHGDRLLTAARLAANAVRAVDAGLGRAPSSMPPALYAYDPDIGRLAITTPAYNTAIVAVNQEAFPYGGIEPARLYDGEQDVAASIGGVPPASFGLVVRDDAGRIVFSTQTPRTRVRRGVTPLRLVEAPQGEGVRADVAPTEAYAGGFGRLRARGVVRSRGWRGRADHLFTADWYETSWTLRGGARETGAAEVHFPSTGDRAGVTAVLDDGTVEPLTEAARPLTGVAYLTVQSDRAGYLVVPFDRPPGVTARLIHPRPQDSAPDPGPSLAIGIGPVGGDRTVGFGARVIPLP